MMASLFPQFDVSAGVRALGVRGFTFILEGLSNRESDPRFDTYRAQRLEELRTSLALADMKRDPLLQGFRDLHTRVGFSNRNFPAASEILLENLLKYNRFPSVNLLVDIYNLVSLETRLALGAHDVARVSGNIHLKEMTGSEGFWPLGSPEAKPARPGGYSYIDDANEILCMLDSKQVEKTRITLETQSSFFILQGHDQTPPALIQQAAHRLIHLTQEYCGGHLVMTCGFGLDGLTVTREWGF